MKGSVLLHPSSHRVDSYDILKGPDNVVSISALLLTLLSYRCFTPVCDAFWRP